jgi:hypothetical protein
MKRRWMNILHAHCKNHIIEGNSATYAQVSAPFCSFLTTMATSSEEFATSQKYFAPVNEPIAFSQ